jgi:hypothetical protein
MRPVRDGDFLVVGDYTDGSTGVAMYALWLMNKDMDMREWWGHPDVCFDGAAEVAEYIEDHGLVTLRLEIESKEYLKELQENP